MNWDSSCRGRDPGGADVGETSVQRGGTHVGGRWMADGGAIDGRRMAYRATNDGGLEADMGAVSSEWAMNSSAYFPSIHGELTGSMLRMKSGKDLQTAHRMSKRRLSPVQRSHDTVRTFAPSRTPSRQQRSFVKPRVFGNFTISPLDTVTRVIEDLIHALMLSRGNSYE